MSVFLLFLWGARGLSQWHEGQNRHLRKGVYFVRSVWGCLESCTKYPQQVLFIFKALVINYSLRHTCEARPCSPLSRKWEKKSLEGGKASLWLRVGSAPEGLLWLGSEHSCWILDLVLCANPYRQSRGRKRKLMGPTGLAERFSWALSQEEAASPRMQHDPLTLLGELFPAIPKDNKSSTRNLLAEQEEKQFPSKCPGEQISFGEDWM